MTKISLQMVFLGAAALALCLISAMAAPWNAASPDRTLTVYASASIVNSLGPVAVAFRRTAGVKVTIKPGTAAELASHFAAGVPAHVLLLDDAPVLEEMAAKGFLDKASIGPVVAAPLILAAPAERMFKAEVRRGFDLSHVVKGKIVVVAPTAGAEGRATKEALERLGWLDGLKPRLITVPDGRSAAQLVDRGGADAAILYACDLAYSMGLEKVAEFPADLAPPVTFSAALCKGAPPSAGQFLAFMREPLAQGYLKNAGFIPLSAAKP